MSDLHRIVSSPVIIKRVTKRPFIFYKKIQIFAAFTKQLFVFLDSEMQNFENCTKRATRFIFYNKIQNFESCTQTAIRFFFTAKCKILKTLPKRSFVLFFTTKYRILKLVPKRPFASPTRKYEI